MCFEKIRVHMVFFPKYLFLCNSSCTMANKMTVMDVMFVIRNASVPLSLSRKDMDLSEWHCLCFTYLWQMLAEWNWIPGKEERDHSMHPILCLGTGFLLLGLDPLIVCSQCWRWIMTKVKGETLFPESWGKAALSTCGFYLEGISFVVERKGPKTIMKHTPHIFGVKTTVQQQHEFLLMKC